MSDQVKGGKWAAGSAYGPVLSQTDLYLLKAELEINPILAGTASNFTLVFDINSGNMGGFNQDTRDRATHFTAKDEPATFPRVSQLYIITKLSPWVTVVRNDRGVTSNDVLTTIWKDYTENQVTDPEFTSLPGRVQEHIRRVMVHNINYQQQGGYGAAFYTPAPSQGRPRRVDWLRERNQFDHLRKDDKYAKEKLGFCAPNVFVMELTG